MQCNAMQQISELGGFPSYDSNRSSVSVSSSSSSIQYNTIHNNACTPEGRPTKQATTLDHLHHTRKFFSSQVDGTLQAKNITLYLFTPSEISAHRFSSVVRPPYCFAPGLEAWSLQAKSYSPPHTLIESFSLGEYGVTLESAMYFVEVRHSRTVPYPSVRVQVRVSQHATCTGRLSLSSHLHVCPPRASGRILSRVVLSVSLNRQNNANARKVMQENAYTNKTVIQYIYITVTAIKTPRLSSASILANPHRWKR
jgi:hypothetical protein